jgi:hypothetical protein
MELGPGPLIVYASTPMLAGSACVVDLKVPIDLAILFISAFYGNHRADNDLSGIIT